jgi:phage tail protein X
MSTKYRTSDGDTIDSICFKFYGATNGPVEAVYEANRGIEDYPAILPAGIEIQLPEITVAKTSDLKPIRLWD